MNFQKFNRYRLKTSILSSVGENCERKTSFKLILCRQREPLDQIDRHRKTKRSATRRPKTNVFVKYFELLTTYVLSSFILIYFSACVKLFCLCLKPPNTLKTLARLTKIILHFGVFKTSISWLTLGNTTSHIYWIRFTL